MSIRNPELIVIEHSHKAFKDRDEAGQRLGKALKSLTIEADVVVGIPRGGVIIGWQLAKCLSLPLDIILSRKIGAPKNPELAIGAVSEDGQLYINGDLARQVRASQEYIDRTKSQEMNNITQRKNLFRAGRPKLPFTGKRVIITDDGVATGATALAAIWAVREENPKEIIVALPVGASSGLQKLAQEADKVICLRVPEYFNALGLFYDSFTQLDDQYISAKLQA